MIVILTINTNFDFITSSLTLFISDQLIFIMILTMPVGS